MKIYGYVDGQLAFNFDIKVPYEKLNNKGREYLGLKGSHELLTVYQQVEDQLKLIFPVNEDSPSLDELSLDEINLNEYLIKKFPQLQQLELRADDESYSSSVKNLFGKQYGYPLVWLNCNKYNHPVMSDLKTHQWERCMYGAKLNSLDKIGSLTQYFRKTEEALFYKGDYNAWLNSVKNSFTDNLLIKSTRQGSHVASEIARMQDFQHHKNFAVFENTNKSQVTYITADIKAALKDSLENHLDSSKTVKILFPIEVSNGSYDHVIMGSITLTKSDDLTLCNITIYDALTSDPFVKEENLELENIKQQIAEIFSETDASVEFSTDIYNMKYQLPLQTHCGRFVMTWMAAEVAGLDIKKLSNYNEPFNYIFGQIAKNDMNFGSKYQRIAPEKALEGFKEDLSIFFAQRQYEFKKQWTNAGKEDLEITTSLLDLIAAVERNDGDFEACKRLVKKLEDLSPYLDGNKQLKNIVDNGMINLGYGTLVSFLTQAKSPDFRFTPRNNIGLQYKKIDELMEQMNENLSFDFDDEDDVEQDKNKQDELEDDFEIVDIDEKLLASNIQPSKEFEQQLKLEESISAQKKLKETMQNMKEDTESQVPTKTDFTKVF